jgi:hypothetical protein
MIADGLSRIAMSSGLAASLARASDYARNQGHAEVTLEHMLLALCDDPDAVLVLAASNVNVSELTAEVDGRLAVLPVRSPGQSGELAVAADFRRILEAAAAAARGGRRREINGAIVLAAIVGDGKSAAAQVLSGLGLTFEGAIRALQSKPSEPSAPAAPSPRPIPAPDAEAILAGARERVQSRIGAPARRETTQPPGAGQEQYAEPEHYEPPAQRALPPPDPARYEPEPQHPAAYEPAHHEQHYELEVEQAPAYEPLAPHQAPFQPSAPVQADHYADHPPPAYELQPVPEEYFEAGPPRPASAPFPPPIPAPASHDGWAPPPSPAPAPPRRFADRVAQPPMPPPPPPMPSPFGGEARPSPPPLAPWPEDDAAPPMPMGVGSGGRAAPPAQAAPGAGFHLDRRGGPAMASQARQGNAGARPVTPRAEIGQLVENIPRSMRVAVAAMIEVRVARADVQALAEGLQGGGAAYQHEVMVTKAMSVRLRAPDGGFFIETASPETQWIEKAMLLSADDFASWRWHVTPREAGRKRLQLIISARTVSADGLAAETALPDQVITVRVRTNYARVAGRWIGWGVAAVAGGLLAKFGEGAFDAVGRMLTG